MYGAMSTLFLRACAVPGAVYCYSERKGEIGAVKQSWSHNKGPTNTIYLLIESNGGADGQEPHRLATFEIIACQYQGANHPVCHLSCTM